MVEINLSMHSLFNIKSVCNWENILNKRNLTSSVFSLILALLSCAYAQEAAVELPPAEQTREPVPDNTNAASLFGFYLGSEIIISKTGRKVDPPAGLSLNIGFECEYRVLKHLTLAPSLDFSFFHYGWIAGINKNGDPVNKTYICEPENRTALTFVFLLDMPVLAAFDINSWTVAFGGGLALLSRFGALEPGVSADEKSSLNSLTAKEELQKINRWFWQNGRFFYPSFRFKTEYTFDSGWKTGIQLKAFLPIFNLWDSAKSRFSDGLIVQVGVILHPAKTKRF